MPTYLYWGEDEYQLLQATQKLRSSLLDPMWLDFNYVKIIASSDEQIIDGLNQAATPPFGMGNRLTWLAETTITQRCSDAVLAELERTISHLPPESYLIFTTPHKPDGRLKSTKLLQKHATTTEFSPIPSWNTSEIEQLVRQSATSIGLKLSPDGVKLLADLVGNDSRRLFMELEKLQLWQSDKQEPLDAGSIDLLVQASAHNSLQLGSAILAAETSQALALVAELLSRNEPPLRISATLTGQFRTWLWVKLMQESGERDDKTIAEAAEVGNPKRIYFLKQEVKAHSSDRLQQALPILLKLESALKSGGDETAALQTAVIQLCGLSPK